jgi:threonine aldolase
MVFFAHPAAEDPAAAARIARAFAQRGILINPPERGLFRFVAHYWIGDAEIEKIAEAASAAFAQ